MSTKISKLSTDIAEISMEKKKSTSHCTLRYSIIKPN